MMRCAYLGYGLEFNAAGQTTVVRGGVVHGTEMTAADARQLIEQLAAQDAARQSAARERWEARYA